MLALVLAVGQVEELPVEFVGVAVVARGLVGIHRGTVIIAKDLDEAHRQNLLEGLVAMPDGDRLYISGLGAFNVSTFYSLSTDPKAELQKRLEVQIVPDTHWVRVALESADPKEAAEIVYTAVWADTSDPSKTYQNAAAALLNELRNRAGLGVILGPNRSLAH